MTESAPGVQTMEVDKVVRANIAKLLRLTGGNSKAELPKDVEVKVWGVWGVCGVWGCRCAQGVWNLWMTWRCGRHAGVWGH